MSDTIFEDGLEVSSPPDPVSEPPFVQKTVIELEETNTATKNDAKQNEKNK